MTGAGIIAAGLLLAVAATPSMAKGPNVAAAHCRITGATGHATSTKSMDDALTKAIADCVGQGGIPACCRTGAYAVSPPQ